MQNIQTPNLAELKFLRPIDSAALSAVRRLVQPGIVTHCRVTSRYMNHNTDVENTVHHSLFISNWWACGHTVQTLVLLLLPGLEGVETVPRKYHPDMIWEETVALA